jgi:hypothetical protein
MRRRVDRVEAMLQMLNTLAYHFVDYIKLEKKFYKIGPNFLKLLTFVVYELS